MATKSQPILRSTADFARHVGLARTTVSRVLNGQPGLKPRTIERVQRALAETGFTPNAHALHLRGKRTATIGICVEDLATPPAIRKLATLQRVLRGRGFSSLIEVFSPGVGREVVRHFQSLRVEGVVFVGRFLPEEAEARIAELNQAGTPQVVIDQHGLRGANTVVLDRAAGMRELVTHLLTLGHRRFGLLGIPAGDGDRTDRMVGIRAALRERGLDPGTCLLSLDHRHERRQDFAFGEQLARSFVGLEDRPTAYLALNDEIGIGALRGFQKAGLKVPRDVSVAGFNNQDICQMTWPTLTTVDQNIDPLVEAAAEVLLAQRDGGPRMRPVIRFLEPRLVPGESTGPVRA